MICGGEFVQKDDTDNKTPNEKCRILDTSHERQSPNSNSVKQRSKTLSVGAGGQLNRKRIGAASLLLNNGKMLWVTGGTYQQYSIAVESYDTEFLSVDSKKAGTCSTDGGEFPTNGAGPNLPESLIYHCLEKVGPSVAIIIGGIMSNPEDCQLTTELNKIEIRRVSKNIPFLLVMNCKW